MVKRLIWIAWEKHRRTIEVCNHFKIPLFTFTSNKRRLIRYPLLTSKTLLTLFKERPKNLFIQCPSVILAMIGISLKKILKYKLIIDAHNACIWPDTLHSRGHLTLLRYVQRSCDCIIVTNERLAEKIKEHQPNIIILPDKIPEVSFEKTRDKRHSDPFKIVYICTFAEDEPYKAFFEAIEALRGNVRVYITGSASSKIKGRYQFNEKLVFTGYLPERSYWRLLLSADMIVDLTYRQDCLLCGAYEAVALGVPLLLSDTIALRSYFRKGVVFCKNDPKEILLGIEFMMKHYDFFLHEIKILKKELESSWLEKAEQFLQAINQINKS